MPDFEDHDGALRRRGSDPMIEVLVHKVTNMERSMDKLTEAITKLAVVEEKQTADRAALERAFMAIQKSDERCSLMFEKTVSKLEKLEGRLDELESAAPTHALTSGWILEGAKALAVVVAVFVLSKSGIM